jgi:hypothetical protein
MNCSYLNCLFFFYCQIWFQYLSRCHFWILYIWISLSRSSRGPLQNISSYPKFDLREVRDQATRQVNLTNVDVNYNQQQWSWYCSVGLLVLKRWYRQTSFLKLSFGNKNLDAINLGNILHHKSVKSKILPYFKDQSVPIISYTYTTPQESVAGSQYWRFQV